MYVKSVVSMCMFYRGIFDVLIRTTLLLSRDKFSLVIFRIKFAFRFYVAKIHTERL